MGSSGSQEALAVTTLKRSSLLKDVPTIDESGVKGFDLGTWFGVFAPGGTPQPIVERLNTALNKALDVPIIPVATNAGLCWPARGTRFTPGLIVYEVLPAIPGGLDRKTLMARLENDLETASNRLIAEGRAAQAAKGVK